MTFRSLTILIFTLVLTTLPGCSKAEKPNNVETTLYEGEVTYEGDDPLLTKHAGKETDSPWWRGRGRDGVADAEDVPTIWTEQKNVIWKSPVPGRGHSSPTVFGNQIFLATADEQQWTQSVVGYNRKTGKKEWETEIHKGGLETEIHRKNSQASGTIACDGLQVYVAFLHNEAIFVTALDLKGNKVWGEKNVGSFDSMYGFGVSPVLYKDIVIVAADNRGGGFIVALDQKSGKQRWKVKRPAKVSFASPIVAKVAGKDQLMIAGVDLLASYDPNSGKEIWSVDETTMSCASTVVAGNDYVIGTGGFPGKETVCVKADGSNKVMWRSPIKAYVPSPVIYNGYYYIASDNGVLYCFDVKTGEQQWKGRISGADISASVVVAGGHLYISNERGRTYVVKATPKKFEIVAKNQLGDEAFATPTICGDRIYIRSADRSSGKRVETLYCIGK